MAAATDAEILERARVDGRVIISADTDFGALLALAGAAAPSLVLFRRSDNQTGSLLDLLLANLSQVQQALVRGSVVVIEDARVRVRSLPFGRSDE